LGKAIDLLTNCAILGRVDEDSESGRLVEIGQTGDFRRDLRAVVRGDYDIVLMEGEPGELLRWCIVRKLLPTANFRIVSLDFLPKRPSTLRERARIPVLRWLLKEVDRFLVYQKETSGFRDVLGIHPERLQFVPFKVNRAEQLSRIEPTDDGVFLSCGRSYRDYATLCEAFRGLPYECRILAQWSEVEQHGTRFDGIDVPPNVKLISDDGSPGSWNATISRARAVILPIDPETLFPAGIGTYLVAMALGKCVIMTTGPGTIGMLDDSMAVLVPPKDSAALREAIRRVASDSEYRERIARGGRAYALALGGEERLAADVLSHLLQLAKESAVGRASAAEQSERRLSPHSR
jgi:glycosyltransferase involved in cell wall biosynthesis